MRKRNRQPAWPALRPRGEFLEDRRVLAAGNSPQFSPLWFGSPAADVPVIAAPSQIDNPLGPTTQTSQSWIVQLQRNPAQTLGSVAETASLLTQSPFPFQIVRGLGQVGLVLVETQGARQDVVAGWLSASPNVAWFEPDAPIHLNEVPNDPSYATLWGLENGGQMGGTVDADIDAAAAWNLGVGSHSIIVGVIDTGVNYNHPDLAANIWTNPGEIPGDATDNDGNGFIDDVHGWDFVNNDNDPLDDQGHGTHVAGTIGAVGDNGVGVVGVNWNVSVMALKALDSTGNGETSDAILAINYAAMMRERGHNVRATNNSWGGVEDDQGLYDAIAANRDQGILFVASAGNSASDNDAALRYPSSYDLDNIIAVAATDRSDVLATFSNYGATSVDLAAPGVSVLSTSMGTSYATLSGTSMAAPHVAGVVALAASVAPDANYQELRAAVLAGVDPLPGLAGKMVTGGRLNAAGTLSYILNNAPASPSLYLAAETSYEALDLVAGEPGVIVVLDDADDSFAALDLGTSEFTFYGVTYSGSASLFVSDNGLLTLGSGNGAAANTNLRATPTQALLAPCWDDLATGQDADDRVLARFDDLNFDSTFDRLVIEWSDVRLAAGSSSGGTFQAILQLDTGAADGNIVFNYVDLDFGDPAADNGASATVGLKQGGPQGLDRLLVSKDNGANPLVAAGQALLLDRTRPSGDVIDVSPDPQETTVPSVDVTFTEPIDPATFDYRDVTLKRNGGPNLITSAVTIAFVSGTTYRINGLAALTGYDGNYELSVNLTGVRDALGHPGTGEISDAWTSDMPPPDIHLVSVAANGLTTLTVTYEISISPSVPFNLGVFRSDDEAFAGDFPLATLPINATADLTIGTHIKTWTIGTGAGQVPLPGTGSLIDLSADYSLLFIADPSDLVAEPDADVPGDNNIVVFSGVYHTPLGQVMVQGSAAADTVNVSGSIVVTVNGVANTYTLADVAGLRVRTHGGNDVVSGSALTKVLAAWGGAGMDALTGGTANDLLYGGGGNDTLVANAGNDLLAGEGDADSLVGGAGNDIYWLDADANLGTETIDEAGGGTDLLDFSSTTTVGVSVNLGVATAQFVAPSLTLTLNSATTLENIIGGTQGDALTGNINVNVLTGGPGDDVLAGGTGNDTYLFDTDAQLGSDTLTELASAGTDLIDFSATTTKAIALDLASAIPQDVNEFLSLTLSPAGTFENLVGGSLGDTLLGNGLANVLTGGPGNDSLTGGGGNDSYVFKTDLALGSDTVYESAGGGVDLLDFASTTTRAITLDLSLDSAQVVNNFLTLTLAGDREFENATGGTQNDILTGNSLANVLTGGAGLDTLTGSGGNDTLVGGSGNDALVGGEGNDIYSFGANSALGSDSLDDSGGTDLLDFAMTSSFAVTLNLALAGAQTVCANLNVSLTTGQFENATGGTQNDTLTGNSLANVLTGGTGNDTLVGGSGNDTLVGGAGNDSLQGGDDNDTYSFAATSALGSDALTESGGIDTLDFTLTTNSAVTVNLATAGAQTVSSNLTLTLGSGVTIENVTGGSQNDVLTGNSLANLLSGGLGNDMFNGGGNDDTLIGGAGNDIYVYAANAPLGSDTIVEATGGGTDLVDFTTTTALGVSLNLASTAIQTVNGNLFLTLSAGDAIENLTGTGLDDVLLGNSLANIILAGAGSDTLSGGAANDTLTGGAGNDTYLWQADVPLGSDTLNETGGGTDTLDFSATTTLRVTVNLGATSQSVSANLSLNLGSATTFERVIGSMLNDILTGNTLDNVLTGGPGSDTLAGLAGADTLIGGAGNDIYVFDADAALGSDVLDESGGGIDTLDFATTTAQALSVDLGIAAAQPAGVFLTLTLSAGDTFENVTGGSLADLLTGNALDNTLIGGLGNDTLAGQAGNDSLTGGAGNDAYLFNVDSPLGSDVLNESGGGIDTLDFSSTASAGVNVDLSLATAGVVHDNLTLTLGSATTFENVIGGGGADTITGNTLVNTLSGGGGGDILAGGAGNDVLAGNAGPDRLLGEANNDSLSGGPGDDVYAFNTNSNLGSDTLTELSGEGADLLDFSASTSLGVIVDLARVTAQGINSNLSFTLSAGDVFDHVVGTSKNDTLKGNTLANMLLGGAGTDALQGFGGRDLLVGGEGADSLLGGDDDDLLISGTFAYFNEATLALNRPALDAILAEWTRTDATYETRIASLRAGVGPSGEYAVSDLTIFSDAFVDSLLGEAGLDWFWRTPGDTTTDLNTGGPETVN